MREQTLADDDFGGPVGPVGSDSAELDVFISYAREDIRPANALRKLLVKNGFEVWSDQLIQPGEQWDDEIDRALAAARCVVVIWSEYAVDSDFVKAEASEALKLDKLVPVSIDDAKPPLEFRRTQYLNVHRSFRRPEEEVADLVAAVADQVDSDVELVEVQVPGVAARKRLLIGALSIALVTISIVVAQLIGRNRLPDPPQLTRVELGGAPRAVAGAGSMIWTADPTAGLLWRVSALDRSYIQAEAPDIFELAASGSRLWTTSLRGTEVRVRGDNLEIAASVDAGGVVDDIAFGFGAMWAAQRELGRVASIDETTLSIGTIDIPGEPTSLAVASSGVWVTDVLGGAVYKVDPVTRQVHGPADVGSSPLGIAASSTHVWTANTHDNTITILDAASLEQVAVLEVGAQPQDIAITDEHVWVVNAGEGTVTQISLRDHRVLQTFEVGASVNRITAVGTSVWVTDPEGESLFTFVP